MIDVHTRTIYRYIDLLIRNPEAHFTRGVGRKVTLKPGETYVVEREYFAELEKTTAADENGQTHEAFVPLDMDSEKLWLNKGARSDLYVIVARVEFEAAVTGRLKKGEKSDEKKIIEINSSAAGRNQLWDDGKNNLRAMFPFLFTVWRWAMRFFL
jgi:hypothetical protein